MTETRQKASVEGLLESLQCLRGWKKKFFFCVCAIFFLLHAHSSLSLLYKFYFHNQIHLALSSFLLRFPRGQAENCISHSRFEILMSFILIQLDFVELILQVDDLKVRFEMDEHKKLFAKMAEKGSVN
jgi:hypothetical protein